MVIGPLLQIVNTVRENKGLQPVAELTPELRLRGDLGFDSLDLAELTARIHEQCGVDVFAEGIVYQVGEIDARIKRGRNG